MKQSLQDLLANVRSVEPDAGDWQNVQTRVLSAMTDVPVVTSGINELLETSAVRQTSALRPSGWTAWLGGGAAVGVLAASLLLMGQPEAFDADSAQQREVLAPHPIGLDVVIDDSHPPRWSRRVKARNRVHARPASQPVVAASSSAGEVAAAPIAAEGRALGESDVEYDRRHLAPIDAALQAQRPRQALALLAAFKPRKLTNYTRALEAIARCNAGQVEHGKQLGQRALPQLTNQGLARRVQAACKVKP